jgi:hypothetical protein
MDIRNKDNRPRKRPVFLIQNGKAMKLLLQLFILLVSLNFFSACANAENVAVVVYGKTPASKQYLRVAQARMEQLITDNGVTVLDQAKAKELEKNWPKLSDPGALITAEDFVENAGKYKISGIYRIYLDVGKSMGMAGIFTATSVADIRFIGEDAKVKAAASAPMGTKGMPPSDGLTESAAINNAIQRAVDYSAGKFGFKVMDITNPRLVNYSLKNVPELTAPAEEVFAPTLLANNDEVVKYAKLIDDGWTSEDATCVRRSEGGNMAVVGTYIVSAMGSTRSYSSALHVVDFEAKKEVEKFTISVKDVRYQKGGSKITDCRFLQTWRYVAAVSQSHLIFADTERGVELGRIYFEDSFKKPALAYLRSGGDDYLVVSEGSRRLYYQIVRE